MLSHLLFELTRIILTLVVIGGFFVSIYLIPLLITYTYETLASSILECFIKIGCIVVLHFFVPLFLLYTLTKPSFKAGIYLLVYGLLMGGMYFLTGIISGSIGTVMFFVGIYFIFSHFLASRTQPVKND